MIKYVETIFYVITGFSYKKAPGSFIFSLRNEENLPPFKAPLKNENDKQAIYTSHDCGPVFGNVDHDLYISDYVANSNTYSHTNFGITYQPPPGFRDKHTILAGTYYFNPLEVEVFYLV